MTPANYGSVFSSCLFGSLMMLYLFVFCRSNRFILRNGTSVIYLAVGVVTSVTSAAVVDVGEVSDEGASRLRTSPL